MGTDPEPFFMPILFPSTIAQSPIASACFPRINPPTGEVVFPFVSAKNDSHLGVIAPLAAPCLDICRNVHIIVCVKPRSSEVVTVWRVDEYSGRSVPCQRRSAIAYPRPVAAANAHRS